MKTSLEDSVTLPTGFELAFQTRNADAHAIYTAHEPDIRAILLDAKRKIKALVTPADYPTKP